MPRNGETIRDCPFAGVKFEGTTMNYYADGTMASGNAAFVRSGFAQWCAGDGLEPIALLEDGLIDMNRAGFAGDSNF